MKKNLIILLAGIIFSIGAMAQTKDKDVKTDEKNLTSSIVDKKEDKHEAGKDLAHLKVKSALEKRKEVEAHKKSIHKQEDHLEAHGAKHPMRKAKYMAKAEKEEAKAKEDK
jgi:hypothetical protein